MSQPDLVRKYTDQAVANRHPPGSLFDRVWKKFREARDACEAEGHLEEHRGRCPRCAHPYDKERARLGDIEREAERDRAWRGEA